MESGSLVTSPLVVPLVHLRCFLSTRSIMPVHVLRMMPSPRVALASLMVCLMSTRRLWLRMALPVSIVVSFLQSLVSLCTVVFTSVYMTRLVRFVYRFYFVPKLTPNTEPVVLVGALEGSFLASFLLGWCVTTGAGIASYPLDTIRRRMMMTSGSTTHYKSMFDAGSQVCCLILFIVHGLICPLRSSPRRAQSRCSRVLVPTSFVESLVLVCCRSMTSFKKSCSARSTPVVCNLSLTHISSSNALFRFRIST